MAIDYSANVRQIRTRIRRYSRSQQANINSFTNYQNSFEIQRVAEDTKFFGQVIIQRLNLKMRPYSSNPYSTDDRWDIQFYNPTDETLTYERYFPYFYTTEVHTNENTNEKSITAYDRLKLLDENTVADVNISAPYTIQQFANAIAKVGGFTTDCVFTNIDSAVLALSYSEGANLEDKDKLLDCLSQIAEVLGAICFVNTDDRIEFRRLDKDGEALYTISRDDYITCSSGDSKRLGTIIYATELGDNIEAHTTENGSTQIVRNNAFLDNRADRETLVQNQLSALGGLTIGTFQMTWRSNPSFKLGDKIQIEAKDGTFLTSYLLDETIRFDGGLSSKLRYYWDQNKEVVEAANPSTIGDAIYSTYAKVDKVNKRIDLVVSDVNTNTSHISGLTEDLESIDSRVTTNTSDISSLELTTDTITANVTNLSSRTESLETTTSTLGTNLTNLQSDVQTNTSDISQLKIDKDSIAASVTSLASRTETLETTTTSLQEEVDNIEVGGRNLFIAATRTNNKYITSSGGLASWSQSVLSDFIAVNEGDNIILQCWKPENEEATGNARAWYCVDSWDNEQAFISRDTNGYFTGEYVVRKLTIAAGAAFIRVCYHFGEDGASGANWNPYGDFQIKVEKGTMPTDWTIAPEDIDSTIATAQSTADDAIGRITTTNTQVAQNTSDISQLKIDKQSITASVSNLTTRTETLETTTTNLQTEVDNIEVGGRNLLLDTKTERALKNTLRDYSLSSYGIDQIGQGDIEITVSMDLKSDTATNIDFYFRYNPEAETNIMVGQNIFSVTTEYKRYKKVITLPAVDYNYVKMRVRSNGGVSGGSTTATVNVKNIKLELGNKATTYTVAPEDTDETISTAQTTADNAATAASGIRADLTTTQTQVQTNTQNIGTLTTTAESITGRVSSLETSTTSNTAAIGTLQTYVDQLEVGGRNLLLDTNAPSTEKVAAGYNRYFSSTSNTTIIPSIVEITDAPINIQYGTNSVVTATGTASRMLAWYSGGKVKLVQGDTYTISCYARVTDGTKMRLKFQYGNLPYNAIQRFDIENTDWLRYSSTFVYDGASYGDTTGVGCVIYIGCEATYLGTLQCCGFKLEKGTEVTDYTVAPEDVDYKVYKAQNTADTATETITSVQSTVSTLSQTTNQISASVSLLEENTSSLTTSLIETQDAIEETSRNVGDLTDNVAGIQNDLSATTETLTSSINTLQQEVNARMTADAVELAIEEKISNGVKSVETETGYRFDKDGLTISKSDSDLTTQIDNTGMVVSNRLNDVLTATNDGVEAVNLTSRKFLIIGNNSRIQDYNYTSTGIFWIGS